MPLFGGSENETGDGGPPADASKLSSEVRFGLLLASVLLFGLAIGAWIGETPPTISSTTENSSKTTIAPLTPAASSTAPSTAPATTPKAQSAPTPGADTDPKTTTEINSKTTAALKGRDGQASEAEPEGAAHRGSDTLLVGLLGVGGVLMLLGAIGKVPSKISKDGLEFPAPPAAAVAEFADQAAKEGLADDPEKLREAAQLFLSHGRPVAKDYPDDWESWLLAARSSVATISTSRGDDEGTSGGHQHQ